MTRTAWTLAGSTAVTAVAIGALASTVAYNAVLVTLSITGMAGRRHFLLYVLFNVNVQYVRHSNRDVKQYLSCETAQLQGVGLKDDGRVHDLEV